MSKQEIQIDTKVGGLASIAALTKAIDKLTDHFDELAKNAEDAADGLDDVNDSLKKTKKEADKGTVEIGELSEKFSKMGGAGGAAAAKIEMLGVMMSGPLGLAIAGAVVALGGVVVAVKSVQKALEITTESVKTYIEGNKTLTKSTETTSNALRTLKETFGAAVIGGEGFKRALDFIASRLRKATDFVKKHAATIFKASKTIANAVLVMLQAAVQLISTMAIGIVAPFDLALTALHKFRKSALELMKSIMDKLGPALVQFGLMTQETLNAQQAVIRNTLAELKPYSMNMIREIHNVNVAIQEELKLYRKVVKELEMGPLNVGTARRTGAPRPTPGPVPRVTGKPTARRFGVVAEDTSREDLLAELQDFETFLGQMIQVGEELKAAMPTEAQAEAAKLAEILRQAVYPAELMVAEGMLGLAESAAQAAGAFMVTGDAFKDFGDVVLDTFGDLSSQIGSFFIRTGIGMTLLNPATGAGLIAAGLGLQVLGGALGAKGSGNRGTGGGGGGGAGVSGAVTREIQRSLRAPDAGGAITNIEVVIAGRAIEPEMVTIIDDISRLRRSRGLARLGA